MGILRSMLRIVQMSKRARKRACQCQPRSRPARTVHLISRVAVGELLQRETRIQAVEGPRKIRGSPGHKVGRQLRQASMLLSNA